MKPRIAINLLHDSSSITWRDVSNSLHTCFKQYDFSQLDVYVAQSVSYDDNLNKRADPLTYPLGINCRVIRQPIQFHGQIYNILTTLKEQQKTKYTDLMYACFSMWLNNINLLQAQLQGFNYTVCFTSRTSKLLDAADFNKPIENLFVPSVETGYLIGSTETYDLVNLVNYTNFLTDVPTLMRIGNFWKFFNLFDIKGMEKSQSHYKNFPISKYFWTHWLQYQNIKVRDK